MSKVPVAVAISDRFRLDFHIVDFFFWLTSSPVPFPGRMLFTLLPPEIKARASNIHRFVISTRQGSGSESLTIRLDQS